LARVLADRCGLLVGIDSDDTIDENPFVQQRVKMRIEEYRSDKPFDVVTFRMVAEHIANPNRVIESLARLTKPGGKVVIYTVNRWSPVPMVTRIVPFGFHHTFKQFLWRTEKKDTFPVEYLMNTRKDLARLFEDAGFRECYFAYLDDCRSSGRFRSTFFLELCAWKFLRVLGLRYPENCLLGVYEHL
jgi:SAM-dependent methyltransferase